MSAFAQWGLMAVFVLVLVAIPTAWYLLGRETYGTGDYYQP